MSVRVEHDGSGDHRVRWRRVAARRRARAVGLVEALDDCVSLKKRARGLSDTQFVMGMAETIAGARPRRVRQGCHRSFESPSLRSVALGVQACPATQGHLAGHGCPSRPFGPS